MGKWLRCYQATLSPDHGWLRPFFPLGYCRWHPTCSQYALEAVERYGLVRGSWLALLRLLRCHPWAAGGIDQIAKIKDQKHHKVKM